MELRVEILKETVTGRGLEVISHSVLPNRAAANAEFNRMKNSKAPNETIRELQYRNLEPDLTRRPCTVLDEFT